MKKVRHAIFIDYRNKEQVTWFNNVASKLVRAVYHDEIVETATGKVIGCIVRLRGPFVKYVVKKNLKFISNPKTITFFANE